MKKSPPPAYSYGDQPEPYRPYTGPAPQYGPYGNPPQPPYNPYQDNQNMYYQSNPYYYGPPRENVMYRPAQTVIVDEEQRRRNQRNPKPESIWAGTGGMLGRLNNLVKKSGDETDEKLTKRKSENKDIEKGFPEKPANPNEEDPEEKIAEMPAFYKKIQELRDGISQLQNSTKEMEDLHRRALDDMDPSSSTKASTMASGLSANVSGLRKELTALKRENERIAKKLSAGNPFVRIRGAQVTQASVSLLSTIQEYEDIQTKYRKKYQEKLQRQYKFIKPTATTTELEKLVEMEDGANSGMNLIRSQIAALGDSRTEARIALEQMRNRHNGMVAIEQSIVELHSLFLQMKGLVYEQGDVIDSIEESVNTAENYTRRADVQLQEAVKHQRARWKSRFIYAVIIISLVTLLGLYIHKQFFRPQHAYSREW